MDNPLKKKKKKIISNDLDMRIENLWMKGLTLALHVHSPHRLTLLCTVPIWTPAHITHILDLRICSAV